jgi:hypothetical protein
MASINQGVPAFYRSPRFNRVLLRSPRVIIGEVQKNTPIEALGPVLGIGFL